MIAKEIKKLSFLIYVCFFWHVSQVAGQFGAYHLATKSCMDKTCSDNGTSISWSSETSISFTRTLYIKVLVYGKQFWNLLCSILLTNCLLAQYLLVTLVIAIARGCLCIRREIESVINCFKPESQVAILQQSRRNFRMAKSLVHQLNDVFSLIVLINCMRDLIQCIALIAFLLSRQIREDDESNEIFMKRYIENEILSIPRYISLAIYFLFAGCRLMSLLYCNAQVRNSSKF
jgi:hypothetical protein